MNLQKIILEEYNKLLHEQQEEHELPPLEIQAGKTIHNNYISINRDKTTVERPYSVYIPPGTDLENANIAVYFHGWEKWREKANIPFPHEKRLEKLKEIMPENTILIVPNLGIDPQRTRPTKDFLNTIKSNLGIKNINNLDMYGHSAGGSTMSRFINHLDDETLKKTRPTYLDATYGYNATTKAVERMKKLNLTKNLHFITKKGSRTDKNARRFANSGANFSRLTGKSSSHSALEVPPEWTRHFEQTMENPSMIKEVIESESTTPTLIKVSCVLKYEKDFTFYGNVLNQIRSIKGVAIAKASDVGVVDIGPNKKMVLLHLKFMPDRPLYQYLTYLQMELKKLKDNDGDRVLTTQIKGIPKKVEI